MESFPEPINVRRHPLEGVERYGTLYLSTHLSSNMTLNAALTEPLNLQTDCETLDLEQAHKAMCEMRAEYQCTNIIKNTKTQGNDDDNVLISMCQIQAPASAEWLKSHYEEQDGISLPRSVVYTHYLDFCVSYNFEPANPAGFGKMIRTVFPRIKTRRLGNRGNSKYHYYGIKIKDQSPYCDILGLTQRVNNTLASTKIHSRTVSQAAADGVCYTDLLIGHTTIIIPGFPNMQSLQCPAALLDMVAVVLQLYKSFCQRFIECLVRADLQQMQSMLYNFWTSVPSHIDNCLKHRYTCEVLALCDCAVYAMAENILVPSILQSLPITLLQDVQSFSKNLPKWTADAVGCQYPILTELKMNAVKLFCSVLQWKTELNHQMSFTQSILHCYDHVITMRIDWLKLDYDTVLSQCSWVLGAQVARDSKRITKYLAEFGNMLEQLVTVDKYFVWLKGLVERFVKKVSLKSTFGYRRIAQEFILKWNVTANCVLKELFLQGAASYGSFQLIHLTLRDFVMLQIQKHEVELNEIRLQQLVGNGKNHAIQDHSGYSVHKSASEVTRPSHGVYTTSSNNSAMNHMHSIVDRHCSAHSETDVKSCLPRNTSEWLDHEYSSVHEYSQVASGMKLDSLDADLCLDCDWKKIDTL